MRKNGGEIKIKLSSIFVSLIMILGVFVVVGGPVGVKAVGALPFYDIEQDSRGNYHKAYIDDSTGNFEIYYTNDIGGSYAQDWNPPTRITDTRSESFLLDLGIYLPTDTMFIIWQETDRVVKNTDFINYPTYYSISRDYGSSWTEMRRSYEDITLKYATFDPLYEEPDLPPINTNFASQNDYYIVQMKTPVLQEWWDGIQMIGGTLYDYIPNNAQVVKMDPLTKINVENLPYVRWVGEFHPMYKMSEELSGIVDSGGTHLYITIDILVFDEIFSVAQEIVILGGIINDISDPYLRVTIDDTKLNDIALIPEVNWMEKEPEYVLFNDESSGIMNVKDVWEHYPVDLTGNGQIIGIADTGLDTGNLATIHPDFQGRVLNTFALGRPGDWSDQNAHGTHVAGSALGNGAAFFDGDDEIGNSIAVVDPAGNIHLTGSTNSIDFPTTANAFDDTVSGGRDAFYVRFDSSGNLVYSTLLGGNKDDYGRDLAVDATGNVYITGSTMSEDFPISVGAFDNELGGVRDVFVTRLDATGALVYSTYLGGNSGDIGISIALDSTNNAYVTGYAGASSTDFPTTLNAYDDTHNGGVHDVFVARFNALGTNLLYSTFIGGSGYDYGLSIELDPLGIVYLTGGSCSSDYPTTTGAFDENLEGTADAIITKLDISQALPSNQLVYSTYVGGDGWEFGRSLALYTDGGSTYAQITGETDSTNFPLQNALDGTLGGTRDAFITKLNPAGSACEYSSYLGGSGYDYANSIDVDAAGMMYFMGTTGSDDFPTTAGAYDPTDNRGSDAFVTNLDPFQINPSNQLIYSTYLGGHDYSGAHSDEGISISIDSTGTAFVSGYTESTKFPTTEDAFDRTHNNGYDAFISKLSSDGSTLEYSTYLGGGSLAHGRYSGMAYDSQLVFQSIMDANGNLAPGNLVNLFQQSYDAGARIHSNSWGQRNPTNPPLLYGQYTAQSHQADTFMWNNQDALVLFAAGNEGNDGNNNGEVDADSLSPPSTAKNVLTVGASENIRPTIGTTYGAAWPADFPVPPINNDPMADNIQGMAAFSGRGPPDAPVQNRIKPDIVAPGTYIISTRSRQWAIDDNVEGGIGGWTPQAPWARTNLASNSGTWSWTDSPGVNYNDNVDIWLDSQMIDLRTGGDTLRTWHRYDLRPNDLARVYIQYNQAPNWWRVQIGEYTDSTLTNFGEEIITLPPDWWLDAVGIPLAAKQNSQIRFRLTTDNDGVTGDGWYIDDIRIYSGGWGRLSDHDFADSGSVLDENYLFMGGTSMATPLTAGAAALVRQYYTDIQGIQPVVGVTPSAALIKATLINGAVDMQGQYLAGGDANGNGATEIVPNDHEGWGRVDLMNTLFPTGVSGNRVMIFREVNPGFTLQGQTNTFSITDCLPNEPLRITLVWTDAPTNPATAGPQLVNDLDLIVTTPIGPGSVEYYGNDFTNGWSNPNILGTNTFDTVNTVENVFIQNPVPGEYTIRIDATALNPAFQPQAYALVISYGQAPETIRLYPEWNFISLPLEPDRPFITEVLRDIDGIYTAVQSYDASDAADPWKHYNPSKPAGLNDLWYITQNMGIHIYIPPSAVDPALGYLEMEVYGAHFAQDQQVNLFTAIDGWNMVGYPSDQNLDRTTGLNNLVFGTHVILVEYFDAQTGRWVQLTDPTDTFERGRAYWFYVIALPTPPVWTVPVT